jgi:hypothetical protein
MPFLWLIVPVTNQIDGSLRHRNSTSDPEQQLHFSLQSHWMYIQRHANPTYTDITKTSTPATPGAGA